MTEGKAPWANKPSTYDMGLAILSGCLAALLIAAIVSIFTGWLVTIVVGYFGYHLTLWQGIVTAFTVSMITRTTVNTSTK